MAPTETTADADFRPIKLKLIVVRVGLAVPADCPDGEDVLEVAVADHAVLVEHPGDRLLRPVSVGALPCQQQQHPSPDHCLVMVLGLHDGNNNNKTRY